jgi:hypothetical protein
MVGQLMTALGLLSWWGAFVLVAIVIGAYCFCVVRLARSFNNQNLADPNYVRINVGLRRTEQDDSRLLSLIFRGNLDGVRARDVRALLWATRLLIFAVPLTIALAIWAGAQQLHECCQRLF